MGISRRLTVAQGIAQDIAAAEQAVQQQWATLIRPDPDMLWTGHSNLTLAEQRTQLGMDALLGVPLITGTDPDRLTASTLALLTNHAVTALAACSSRPHRLPDQRGVHVWIRTCNGHRTLAVYNPTATVEDVNLHALVPAPVTDLWSGTKASTAAVEVAPHDTVLLAAPQRDRS